MSEVLKNTIPPTYDGIKEKGSPVYYGDKITLINNGTGQKLHSHQPWNECHDISLLHNNTQLGSNSHAYMLNDEYQEVTCLGDKKVNTTKLCIIVSYYA
ncbi:31120_t:CDS:2 [Gigaspora margarita]|uniref:31120_t:CDS:1 n=1 Tax=Gigaspora margarita TaxID=4874 RepID=A0ABN7U990_GIGMA|nr:31120_t:CDS:2 [Gigaspora margarita]